MGSILGGSRCARPGGGVPTGVPVSGDQGFGLSAARPLKVIGAVPVLGLSPGCADAAFCWEVIAGV